MTTTQNTVTFGTFINSPIEILGLEPTTYGAAKAKGIITIAELAAKQRSFDMEPYLEIEAVLDAIDVNLPAAISAAAEEAQEIEHLQNFIGA